MTRRWFNGIDGFDQRNFTLEQVCILEYVIPGAWLGGAPRARFLGNPAIDSLVLDGRNWSDLIAANYGQWIAGLMFKMGWRF
jgi:hypothetical protein